MWDPAQYLSFADERARPFFDLVARIGATAPRYVADLGCGPGQLTMTLAQRWPQADVEGIDSSAEMIGTARRLAARQAHPAGRLSFLLGDAVGWKPGRAADVIVSNSMLHWIPWHLDLLPRWASFLADGGWLAFQLPGNFEAPAHTLMRELAALPRWREPLSGVRLSQQARDPADYLDLLARLGLSADVWETTYLHVLTGPDPVTEWYKGAGLRPVLNALGPGAAAEFLADYGERVRAAYPAASYGTVLPFRRVFAVGHKR